MEDRQEIMKLISRLGIGPMSSEIIEAVFRYSEEYKTPLMLIASKNQIDWSGGYVNNWNTTQYASFIKKMRTQHPNSKVYICRDHCGPGFNGKDLKDTKNTVSSDIENNFDLIHVDYSKYKGTYSQIKKLTIDTIKFIHKSNPKILLEVGTDENIGKVIVNQEKIREELNIFTNIAPIHFYVHQTGSLILEINQVGSFNKKSIRKIKETVSKFNVFLKEHNADYLTRSQIGDRKGVVDAQNIAPQCGVIQTSLLIEKGLEYGININPFLNTSYESKKWEKWLYKNNPENKFLCSLIAGHYCFSTKEYKKIVDSINKYENFSETVISSIINNIDNYVNSERINEKIKKAH
ncbi:hypothetical protein HOD19_03265 [bacterium]|jgi:fructose/tagatose bisphosphate aldolase|nr:hypothetical protein [bacterium]